MSRRLFLLNGLAILAVVCNHAAGWGFTAMFWWTHQYRPVSSPNFDQLSTLPYYALLVVKQLTVFSVPAFLFVSGFFVAYAARGSQSTLNWKMVRVRITNLLVPYVIWSLVIFSGDFLQGITYAPAEYLKRVAFGGATSAYFYVPLLFQFYLLSPLVVPIAKARARLLLFVSALVQLGVISLRYLDLFGADIPGLIQMRRMTPSWLFVKWAFFFAFGVVSSFHLQQLKQWLARVKWGLLVAVVVLGSLAILETEVIYRSTGEDWRGNPLTISASLFAVTFILCFLAFDKVSIPFSKTIYQLGNKTYGIYLLHPKALELVARVTYHIAPWILGHQFLFQPLLIIFGMGGPLLFMTAVARSPARRSYRYLFG